MTMLALSHPFPAGTDIGTVLTPHPGQYKLSLGHMQDLTIGAFGLFRGPLLLIGLALLAGTGANWLLRRRGKLLPANLAIVAMMVVVLLRPPGRYPLNSPPRDGAANETLCWVKNCHQRKIRNRLHSVRLHRRDSSRRLMATTEPVVCLFFPGAPDISRRPILRGPLEWPAPRVSLHRGLCQGSSLARRQPQYRIRIRPRRRQDHFYKSSRDSLRSLHRPWNVATPGE